jgi:hypothetical protein
MTPDTPNADPARPAPEGTGDADRAEDAEDWWDGKVDTSASEPEAAPAAAEVAPAEGGTPDPGDETKQRLLIAAAAAAAVVAVVGIGLAVTRSGDDGADAATGGTGQPMRSGGGPGTSGTISSVDADGGTLTIDGREGDDVEVVVADDTTISEMVEGSAADLAEGDSVLVVGSSAGSGDNSSDDSDSVEASQIVASSDGDLLDVGGPAMRPDGGPGGGDSRASEVQGGAMPEPPEGFEPNGDANREQQGPASTNGPSNLIPGTIESIDGDTLTVTTSRDETITVTLSDDTTVVRSEERELSDLEEGDTVAVTGASDDGTVTARSIRVNPQMDGVPGGGPAGPGGMPGGPDGADGNDSGDSPTENENGA